MIRRIKSVSLYLLLAGVILLTNPNIAYGATIEKGDPVAYYDYDRIILADDTVIDIPDNYMALFINGTLVTDYDVIIRENRALVPIRLVSQELGSKVDWDETTRGVTIEKGTNKISITINDKKAVVNGSELILDYPAILYEDLTYVPLRFITENLDGSVVHTEKLDSDYTYYYDTQMPVSPADTIIREFPNIIIDEKESLEDKISKERAREEVKRMCSIGFENFKRTTIQKLIESGETSDH